MSDRTYTILGIATLALAFVGTSVPLVYALITGASL